jgi:hypothetical protein
MMLVGNSLYVGGSFTRYQGQPAHGLVKLDATTCALDQQFTRVSGFDGLANTASFVFPPIANVTNLVTDGTSLFAGGDFSSYRGLPAFGLAKLDLVTGNLDQTFTQAAGFNDAVGPLAVSGDAVFVSGRYTAYRGSFTTANSLVLKLNKMTGAVEPAFNVPSTSGGIFSIAVSGTSVYIGGGIPGVISKLDATTGAVDTMFRNNLGSVQARANILVLSGGSLYAGGNWTSLGGVPAGHIAKIDATTGKPDLCSMSAALSANAARSACSFRKVWIHFNFELASARAACVPSGVRGPGPTAIANAMAPMCPLCRLARSVLEI